MKRITQKIKSYSKSIELNEGEQDALRARLVLFMADHPLPTETTQKALSIKSPFEAFFHITFSALRQPVSLALIIMLLAGGSITWAAQDTLPGDALYGIKLNVTESIVDAITIGTESQARLDAEKAERRIEEIEILLAANKLDDRRRGIAEKTLVRAFGVLEASASELEKESPEKKDVLSRGFVATLDAHTALLLKMNGDNEQAATTLQASIAKAKNQASHSYNPDTGEIILPTPTLQSATAKLQVAENRLNRVAVIIEHSNLDEASAEHVRKIMTRAEEVFMKGSNLLSAGFYIEAREAFVESMTLAQEAKLSALVPKFKSFDIVDTATTTSEVEMESRKEEKDNKNENAEEDEKNDNKEEKNKAELDVKVEVENIEVDVKTLLQQ